MQVGSIAAMIIGQRHVPTSTFGFEVDSLDALSNHEIDAAAVTPTIAAYFNLTHPDKAVRILPLDENEANLNWNVAVGMIRPDDQAARSHRGRARAVAGRRHDRAKIYQRYGVVLQAPK